jgi:alpha-beta hydrolase superfamily lysophospholipase
MRGLLLALGLLLVPAFVVAGEVPTEEGWAAATRTVALADGPTLAYVETGDPAGPPLLLVHGYADNGRSWSRLAVGRSLQLVDAAHRERLRAALPAARSETFAGHGRNMFREAPEPVGATVETFLGD